MVASKKIAIGLVLLLTLGTYHPAPAHAFDIPPVVIELTKKTAEAIFLAVVGWLTTETLNTAKAEAQAEKGEEEKESSWWWPW